MVCQYLTSYRAGEPLDYDLTDRGMRISDWTEWMEFECTNMEALNEDGCPYLDDYKVECCLKEGHIGNIVHWAISKLAGDRKDIYTRVRELMVEDEG